MDSARDPDLAVCGPSEGELGGQHLDRGKPVERRQRLPLCRTCFDGDGLAVPGDGIDPHDAADRGRTLLKLPMRLGHPENGSVP